MDGVVHVLLAMNTDSEIAALFKEETLMNIRCIDGVTVCTLAPFGGVKAKLAAAGVAKVIEVNPVWNAGLAAPRAKTCTPSTTPGCCAASSTTTRPTRERLSLGAITSW